MNKDLDYWELGQLPEGRMLLLSKKQSFAPEQHKGLYTPSQVLSMINRGQLTSENVLTFREWREYLLPKIGLSTGEKELQSFYVSITPAYGFGVDLNGRLGLLGYGRLLGEDGWPRGTEVAGFVKHSPDGRSYADIDDEVRVKSLEYGKTPLARQLGITYGKLASFYFRALSFGFTCPILNEDRVFMNTGGPACIITANRI